jgi:PKHD-type hydroxylase
MGRAPWHERGPYVVEKVVPDEICGDLLDYFRASPSRPRSYQGNVDLSKRHCDYVEVASPENVLIHEILANQVNELFNVRSQTLTDQPLLIYRYSKGVGFVTHHDEVTDIELERSAYNRQPVLGGDITTVLFLNHPDEYAGGALCFEKPGLELRPSKGTLVAFPATREFMHSVQRIEEGERYTLLGRRAVVKVI